MAHGGSRPGAGRPKGTPNKGKTELAELIREACGDYDPVVGMALIASGKALDIEPTVDQRITCMKEVAKYMHAQRKAVEHSVADDSGPLMVPFVYDPKTLPTDEQWEAQQSN